MNCGNCNKKLTSKWAKKFCNKSCAGTYNGIHFPKRSKERNSWPVCKTCTQKVYSRNAKHCRDCIKGKKHYHGIPAELQTIEECSKRKGANRYDLVRTHARRTYASQLNNPCCQHCGYNKHVELCHKKPIFSFPKETTIAEVNSIENILFLCPNCHWEFDTKATLLVPLGQ
jgi:hypothetical protein